MDNKDKDRKPNTGRLFWKAPEGTKPACDGPFRFMCPECSAVTDFRLAGWNKMSGNGKPYTDLRGGLPRLRDEELKQDHVGPPIVHPEPTPKPQPDLPGAGEDKPPF